MINIKLIKDLVINYPYYLYRENYLLFSLKLISPSFNYSGFLNELVSINGLYKDAKMYNQIIKNTLKVSKYYNSMDKYKPGPTILGMKTKIAIHRDKNYGNRISNYELGVQYTTTETSIGKLYNLPLRFYKFSYVLYPAHAEQRSELLMDLLDIYYKKKKEIQPININDSYKDLIIRTHR